MKKIVEKKKSSLPKIMAYIFVLALLVFGILIIIKKSKTFNFGQFVNKPTNSNEIVQIPTQSPYRKIILKYLADKNYSVSNSPFIIKNKPVGNSLNELSMALDFIDDQYNFDPLILISLYYYKSYYTNINLGSINWNIWQNYHVPDWTGNTDTNSIEYNVVMSGFIYNYYYGHYSNQTKALMSYLGIKGESVEAAEKSNLYDIIDDYSKLLEIKKEVNRE